MNYYVYHYLDPTTNMPFYIGKGKGNRLLKHLKETKYNTENKKKYAYIQGLRNKGLAPIIEKIAEGLNKDEAYDLEEQLIKKYGRINIDENGILTNICPNNRPPVNVGKNHPYYGKKRDIETCNKLKKRIAERMLGKTYEEIYGEERAKLIKEKCRNVGEKNGFFGKTHSLETKFKMSIKAKARSNNRLGKLHSAEAKIKVGLNNPNRKQINTPYGKFPSAEQFAKQINIITANGIRNLLKNCDSPINELSAKRCRLFDLSVVGKTPRELGYYYI